MKSNIVKSVCIIGAGAAGLVATREALRAGFDVVTFEATSRPGGVWVYSEGTEDDPLGVNPSEAIYGSLYASLTTNLPRDLMAYADYTFDSAGGGEDNWHRFPGHAEVLTYLERFARDFDLLSHIRFETTVTSIAPINDIWRVTTTDTDESFDAVMICNGHYSKPRIPSLAGIEKFSGSRSHSHNYRRPDSFDGQRVLLWGTSASGFDIGRELLVSASHVYISGNAFAEAPKPVQMDEKLTGLPSPSRVDEQGKLVCGDHHIEVNHLMYCTGYEFSFPFLQRDIVDVEDNHVSLLYQDIVPIDHPTMGFIGLPYLIVPFPLFEMQARWFVGHLAGRFDLPARNQMAAATLEKITMLSEAGTLKRHFHRLGPEQETYYNLLAKDLGADPMPAWFMQTWQDVGKAREASMTGYKEADFPVRGPTVCTKPPG